MYDYVSTQHGRNCLDFTTTHLLRRNKQNANLDGVILVRSSPSVLMTRRPRIHNPSEMPKPPNNRMKMGVGSAVETSPVVPINHRDTSGPIALLGIKQYTN